MIDARLPLALADSGLELPAEGRLLVYEPPVGASLDGLPKSRVDIVADAKPAFDHWTARNFRTVVAPEGDYAAAVLCVPRAKPLARAVLAEAAGITSGPIVVDGQKTDGIDSLLREVRRRGTVSGPVTKAHGKLFWFDPEGFSFEDWRQGPVRTPGGFWAAPGVFSADAVDPASALLADHLPDRLGAKVGDLGAGWGFLSAHILTRQEVEAVHLVEAGHMALECARRNVTDPRAHFHWADATQWAADAPLDMIVMNPPFHRERIADPALGQAFIASAARLLQPRGRLWMVANRHLPYEAHLGACFANVETIGEDRRFKIFHAARPRRTKSSSGGTPKH